METLHQCDWSGDGFVQNLPKLLLPRILAEGYFLQHEDEGKQVFVRGKGGKPGWAAWFRGATLDEYLESFILTASYVLTPQKTVVRFDWANCLKDPWRWKNWGRQWVCAQAKNFPDYLNAWWEAQKKLASEPEEPR